MKMRLFKKFFLLLLLSVLISSIALPAYAADHTVRSDTGYPVPSAEEVCIREVSLDSDGSWTETIVELRDDNENRSSVTGTKTKRKYNSDNELLWKVVLTGTFYYNGTTSYCTSASTAVTFYKSGWSVLSENTYYSGNTAYTNVSLGITVFGVTLEADNVHLTLSCDKDGNLS